MQGSERYTRTRDRPESRSRPHPAIRDRNHRARCRGPPGSRPHRSQRPDQEPRSRLRSAGPESLATRPPENRDAFAISTATDMQTAAVKVASIREFCKNSRKRSTSGVPRGPVASSIAQLISCAVGAPNANARTLAQATQAANARTPRRRRGAIPAPAPAAWPNRALPRSTRSSPMIIRATTSTRVANSLAASRRSNVPRQIRKTPTDTVSTPKYCTVAKSVSVSIITIAAPAPSAGRRSGNTTRRAASIGLAPRLRATSYAPPA